MRKNIQPANSFLQRNLRASVAENAAPQEEFAFASALIKARGDADMTAGSGGRDGHNPGSRGSARKRKGTSLNPHTRAVCEGNKDAIIDQL